MAEVFVSEGSLDLEREVVVHAQHREDHLVLPVALSDVIANDAPESELELPQVPASASEKVRVYHGGREDNATNRCEVREILEELNAVDVRLHLRMEGVAGSLVLLHVVLEHA